MAIFQRLAFLPGAVFVGEVYALTERRMTRLPQFDDDVRAGDGQILLLKLDESRRSCAVVPCDLQAESVGLMFIVARVGKNDWRDNQEIGAEEQDEQR